MEESTCREEADFYQDLFNHMHRMHGVVLNINEMDEIIFLSNEVRLKFANQE